MGDANKQKHTTGVGFSDVSVCLVTCQDSYNSHLNVPESVLIIHLYEPIMYFIIHFMERIDELKMHFDGIARFGFSNYFPLKLQIRIKKVIIFH